MPKTLFTNFAKLEQDFKDAVGVLPNYRRAMAFEYVNALKKRNEELGKEIDELATKLAEARS